MIKLEMQEKVNKLLQELDMCSEIAKRYNQDFYCFFNRDLDKDIAKLNVELRKIPELNELWLKTKELRARPLKDDDFVLLNYIFDDHTYNEREYTMCDSCYCVYLDPSMDYSYYKEGGIVEDEWGIKTLCTHCIQTNYKEKYIDDIKNNPKRIVSLFSKEDMEKDKWETITKECKSGICGINHNPETIYEYYRDVYPENNYDLIFVRTDKNPFAINFVLMAKKKGE